MCDVTRHSIHSTNIKKNLEDRDWSVRYIKRKSHWTERNTKCYGVLSSLNLPSTIWHTLRSRRLQILKEQNQIYAHELLIGVKVKMLRKENEWKTSSSNKLTIKYQTTYRCWHINWLNCMCRWFVHFIRWGGLVVIWFWSGRRNTYTRMRPSSKTAASTLSGCKQRTLWFHLKKKKKKHACAANDHVQCIWDVEKYK